jgi:PIN domain nuclease of toxin-antitoxin system
MDILLDTHAFLWWLSGNTKLSNKARISIAGSGHKYVSSATAWEIVTKFRVGRLPGIGAVAADVPAAILSQNFRPLAIGVSHAQAAAQLPDLHRDPFDRLLIAQSNLEGMRWVSGDSTLDAYGISRLW